MGEKQLLIVGVDPGTTLGYAVIDFEGNIVKLHSQKNMDLGMLISELIKLGRPLIVAGDKQYNPDFVDRLAVKIGARVIAPDYDLKVNEKREIVRGIKTENQHETDALASALFALKKIGSLLKKINIFVEHYKKGYMKYRLIEFVVGKGLNIREAVEIIEEPNNKEVKMIKEAAPERKLKEKDFLTLYKKVKESKKDISLLREQNAKLRDQIKSIRRDYEYMFKQISRSQLDRKMQSLLDFKERRIKFFDSKLKKKEDEMGVMQTEITTLIYFLSNMNSSVLLKKLDNFGREFERKKDILNIKQGDILLVKDPDIVSEKTIDIIKDKVEIVFYRKQVSKKIESKLPFIFIDANLVNIEEDTYFGILNRDEFEKVRNKSNILQRIVKDYKRERLT